MKTGYHTLTFLILLTFLIMTRGAVAGGKVTSSADPWEPFVDPDDPDKGIALAIISAAFSTQGYQLEHQFQPWKRAMHYVKNSKIDILPGTWITEERKAFLRFSDHYIVNNIKLIKRKDNPFTYTGIDSIAGMKVGTIGGYGYPEIFANSKAIKDPTNDFQFVIKKLLAGRVAFAIEDEIVAKYKINKMNPEHLGKIEFLEPALSANTLHVTCAIENPRCEGIINAFNAGLTKIKASGEYDNILKKYGIQ